MVVSMSQKCIELGFDMAKNPYAVKLGRKGGKQNTAAQNKARAANLMKARKAKSKLSPRKK